MPNNEKHPHRENETAWERTLYFAA